MGNTEWSGKLDYLLASRYRYHNPDYLEFLVKKVWCIGRPSRLIDFGCGYGYFGLQLLSFLPQGTEYTGIDESETLIAEGRRCFTELEIPARFICADALKAPVESSSFDVAICHAYLMHQPDPLRALKEMIRTVRDGGLIIVCESNWNAVNALLHIEELKKSEYADLGFLQQLFERDCATTGKDGNIGSKMPVLFQQAGLMDIEARLTDSVKCHLPPVESDEQKRIYASIKSDLPRPQDEEKRSRLLKHFLDRGFSQEESSHQTDKENILGDTLERQGRSMHIIMPTAMTFTSGKVRESTFLCSCSEP